MFDRLMLMLKLKLKLKGDVPVLAEPLARAYRHTTTRRKDRQRRVSCHASKSKLQSNGYAHVLSRQLLFQKVAYLRTVACAVGA